MVSARDISGRRDKSDFAEAKSSKARESGEQAAAGAGKKKETTTSSGSTLRPVYGERRPVMYHLFETEMESISAFNATALSYFSFGGFLAGLFLNIGLTAIFAPPPLTAAEILVVRWGLTGTGGLALLCFCFGASALYSKLTLIKQIKRETITPAQS